MRRRESTTSRASSARPGPGPCAAGPSPRRGAWPHAAGPGGRGPGPGPAGPRPCGRPARCRAGGGASRPRCAWASAGPWPRCSRAAASPASSSCSAGVSGSSTSGASFARRRNTGQPTGTNAPDRYSEDRRRHGRPRMTLASGRRRLGKTRVAMSVASRRRQSAALPALRQRCTCMRGWSRLWAL